MQCAHDEVAVSRAEIQAQFGVTSDQERTKEVLERMGMALPRHGCGFEQPPAIDANCGVELQSWQNDDWADSRRGDTDTRSYRRGQIYRRISLIESGIGPIHSRHRECTNRCAQQKKNQNRSKLLHINPPKSFSK